MSDVPVGWDLANPDCEGWRGVDVVAQIDPQPVVEYDDGPDYDDHYEQEPEQTPAHYVPLGHDGWKFYFFTSGGGQVLELSARDLQTVGCLLLLAPLMHWEQNYPGRGEAGFNSRSAGNDLLRQCYKVGIYDAGSIRGRGAWLDNGRGILHLGDHCIIDGVKSSIAIPNSRYIYEQSKRMDVTLGEPLTNANNILGL
jgi:putative DNA primase/helicase